MKPRIRLIVLAVVAGAVIAWVLWPGSKSTPPASPVDSLTYYRRLEELHRDTANQLHTQNEEAWKVYHDTAAMATPRWDSLRTRFRDRVRAEVRRKLARQSGPL